MLQLARSLNNGHAANSRIHENNSTFTNLGVNGLGGDREGKGGEGIVAKTFGLIKEAPLPRLSIVFKMT